VAVQRFKKSAAPPSQKKQAATAPFHSLNSELVRNPG